MARTTKRKELAPPQILLSPSKYTNEQIIECFQTYAKIHSATTDGPPVASALVLEVIARKQDPDLRLLRIIYEHVHDLAHPSLPSGERIIERLLDLGCKPKAFKYILEHKCTCTRLLEPNSQLLFKRTTRHCALFRLFIEHDRDYAYTYLMKTHSQEQLFSHLAFASFNDLFEYYYTRHVLPRVHFPSLHLNKITDSLLCSTKRCRTTLQWFAMQGNLDGVRYIQSLLTREQYNYMVLHNPHGCRKCWTFSNAVTCIAHSGPFTSLRYFLDDDEFILQLSRHEYRDDLHQMFDHVISRNSEEMLVYLLERFTLNENLVRSVIVHAVEKHRLSMIKMIHRKFGDSCLFFTCTGRRETLIYKIAGRDEHAILEYLLEHASSLVNTPSMNGKRPLDRALGSTYPFDNALSECKLLMRYGARFVNDGVVTHHTIEACLNSRDSSSKLDFVLPFTRGAQLLSGQPEHDGYHRTWPSRTYVNFTRNGHDFASFIENFGVGWCESKSNRRQYALACLLRDRQQRIPQVLINRWNDAQVLIDSITDDLAASTRYDAFFSQSLSRRLLDDYEFREEHKNILPSQRRIFLK